MYSVRRLRLLREVSIRGSLAAAAAALGYNPSSVSHQLKALEVEVGTMLLEPVGRGVRLTEAARILVARTEIIIGELEAAEADLAGLGGSVRGTLRIAAFQTALHTIVPPAVAALRQRHPELEILTSHINVEEGVPALLAHDFDLVLIEDHPSRPHSRPKGVDVEELGRDRLRLLTPRHGPQAATADASATGPVLSACRDSSWTMEWPGTSAGQWSRAECRRAGFEPRIGVDTSDVVLQVRLVSLGHACALVPDLALRAAGALLESESVIISELPDRPARTISTAVRRGSAQSPNITALREALHSSFIQNPETQRSEESY